MTVCFSVFKDRWRKKQAEAVPWGEEENKAGDPELGKARKVRKEEQNTGKRSREGGRGGFSRVYSASPVSRGRREQSEAGVSWEARLNRRLRSFQISSLYKTGPFISGM